MLLGRQTVPTQICKFYCLVKKEHWWHTWKASRHHSPDKNGVLDHGHHWSLQHKAHGHRNGIWHSYPSQSQYMDTHPKQQRQSQSTKIWLDWVHLHLHVPSCWAFLTRICGIEQGCFVVTLQGCPFACVTPKRNTGPPKSSYPVPWLSALTLSLHVLLSCFLWKIFEETLWISS